MPKQPIAQSAPEDTDAVTLITWPRADRNLTVKTILVCNVTASAATFRIFHPHSTTETYDTTTTLFYDGEVNGNITAVIELDIELTKDAPYLGVQSGTANALTFSAYGGY